MKTKPLSSPPPVAANDTPLQVTCRQCGKLAAWHGNRWRPFCSERCKLIDLGEWAAERYSVPASNGPDFTGDDDGH